jgi:hypothetical protein
MWTLWLNRKMGCWSSVPNPLPQIDSKNSVIVSFQNVNHDITIHDSMRRALWWAVRGQMSQYAFCRTYRIPVSNFNSWIRGKRNHETSKVASKAALAFLCEPRNVDVIRRYISSEIASVLQPYGSDVLQTEVLYESPKMGPLSHIDIPFKAWKFIWDPYLKFNGVLLSDTHGMWKEARKHMLNASYPVWKILIAYASGWIIRADFLFAHLPMTAMRLGKLEKKN